MISNLAIHKPDPLIAAFYEEWTTNRHVVEGSRAVKAASRLYLDIGIDQTEPDYAAYVKRVPFYPAASRTRDGLMGLIFRKPASITCPAGVKDVMETLTAQGFTCDDLAEEIASEILITNFCALVTDYPVAPSGLTRATAIDQGYRPFVALYKAESILGIETAVINNRQRVVRVRLLDDKDTVRELRLDDGIYSIVIHRNNAGQWKADAPIQPTKAGVKLDEIPFTLVSTSRDFKPAKAPLTHVCELNIDHYRASADYATMRYFSTIRLFVTYGLDPEQAAKLAVYPGATFHVSAKKSEASVEMLGSSDNTISELKDAMLDIEAKMAAVGSRILANDKAAAEAAETLAIRRASENATLAAIARLVSRKINDALAWVCWWLDLPEDAMQYETNTDYNVIPMTAQDITVRFQLMQGGAISHDTWAAMMVEGDVLPEAYDAEADRQLVADTAIDLPTTKLSNDSDPTQSAE